MSERRKHPAVYAGLLGSAVWGVPAQALALSLEDTAEALAESLALKLALGCAVGAVVAGGVAFYVYRQSKTVEEPLDEGWSNAHWSSSSLNLLREQELVSDDEPTGDLGRIRTSQITIDPLLLAESEQANGQASRRPRHSARLASTHVVTKAPEQRAGRHFAETAEPKRFAAILPAVSEAPAAAPGRHFATQGAQASVNRPVVPTPVQKQEVLPLNPQPGTVPAAAPKPVADSRMSARERLMNLPSIESRYDKARAVPAVVSEANPAEALSTNRTASSRSREKAETQQAGITGRIKLRVREVLAARLEADALDGVPIIARADGSVSDVTPTWFDQTLVPKLASLTGINNKLEDTAARGLDAQNAPAEELVSGIDNGARASYIASHVAEVNVGMFPERRSVEDLEHGDIWEQALEAMSDRLGQSSPVFQDMVGGPSTIDDPDGLEGSTAFIPFRVPAAHPEVVDTDTYVDYLLRDELSHSNLQVLRHSPHAHLRVIEGGTGNLRMHRRADETGAVRTGRHFAQPAYAQEA